MKLKTLQRFRITALLEGLSYVFLVFIAMPLKYLADIPIYVRISGMIHGILFIFFCLFLLLALIKLKWPLKRAIIAFVASLIPLGAFWFDKSLKREEVLLKQAQYEYDA
ncbi:DUF3817 domain-containing protein [Puniceicoccaceae bacterium K14]|nr:DUF3817 domain-containing protein [Puniceicoccaceae bacterium K14]